MYKRQERSLASPPSGEPVQIPVRTVRTIYCIFLSKSPEYSVSEGKSIIGRLTSWVNCLYRIFAWIKNYCGDFWCVKQFIFCWTFCIIVDITVYITRVFFSAYLRVEILPNFDFSRENWLLELLSRLCACDCKPENSAIDYW